MLSNNGPFHMQCTICQVLNWEIVALVFLSEAHPRVSEASIVHIEGSNVIHAHKVKSGGCHQALHGYRADPLC